MSSTTPVTSGTMGISPIVGSAVVGPLTTGTRQPNPFIRDYFPVVNQNTAPYAYGNAKYDHYDLPKAMEDNIELLMATVEGLLLNQNEWWQTGVMCPYVRKNTDKFVIKKRVLEPAIMKNIPHEGVPDLMEWSETRIAIQLERIGLAFRFEHEYRATAEGQIKYMEGIIGFSKFFQEKVNHRVVNAVMNAERLEAYYRDPTNPGPYDFEGQMEMEVRNFAGLQNPDEGWRYLPNIYNQYRTAMIGAENGAPPDLLIIPSGMRSAYTTGGHPKILDFNIQGQNGINLLIKGPEAITFTDGVRIVETPDYSARHNGPAMRLMSRNTIVSQVIPQRSERALRSMAHEYRSADRAVGVYNMTNDKVDWIDLKTSARNCGIWNENGTGYSDETRQFIEKCGGKWVYSHNDQKDYCKSKDRMLNMHPDAVPHMFASCATVGNSNEYKPATHFGMLEEHVYHTEHMQFMAETAFSAFCEHNNERALYYRDALRQLYELVDEMENAAVPDTAEGAKAKDFGTLQTYVNNAKTTSLSGLNSGVGLLVLSQADDASGLIGHREKARNVVNFLTAIAIFVKNTLPGNEYADDSNVETFWGTLPPKAKMLALIYGLFCMRRPNLFIASGKVDKSTGDYTSFDGPRKLITDCVGSSTSIDATTTVNVALKAFEEFYTSNPTSKHENRHDELITIYNYIVYKVCMDIDPSDPSKAKNKTLQIIKDLYEYSKTPKDTKKHKFATSFIPLALAESPAVAKKSTTDVSYEAAPATVKQTILAYTPNMKGDEKFSPGDPKTNYTRALATDLKKKDSDSFELIATTLESRRSPHMWRLVDTPFARARIPQSAYVHDDDVDAPRDNRFGRVIKSSIDIGDMYGSTSGTTSKKLASDPFTHPGEWLSHLDFARPHFQARWDESNKVGDSMIGAFMKLMLMTRADNLSQIDLLVDSDIYLPVDFYLWQPFAEFIMSSMCLAVAGLQTGATFWGNAAISKASDGITRLGTVFFTAYENPVIYEPKNVRPIFDVKSEKYQGGLTTTFITQDDDIANFNTEDANIHRPSIIATAIPVTEPDMPRTLNLMGKINVPVMAHRERYRNTYSTSAFTNYRFPSLASIAAFDIGQRTFDTSSQAVTLNARRARHWVRDSKTGQVICVQGNGHLNFATYVGAAAVCDGGPYHKHATNHM